MSKSIPYVYVNLDGSVRELTEDEKVYLSESFHPNDGARPYIKQYYTQLTPGNKIHGFLLRDKVPKHIPISQQSSVPSTRKELVYWMQEHCYNFNDYSIDGNFIWEGFGIEKVDNTYEWYFIERGHKKVKNIFKSEKEIVAHAFQQIKEDMWACTHCIGFLFDKEKVDELKEKLESIPIKYISDEIPYYGPEKPAYRVFVFGCDIKRVEGLKLEYFKPEKNKDD